MTQRQNLIFLSYAHENLEMVQSIYSGLVKRSLNVWFDKEHLRSGKWRPQITKAIAQSRYFFICISLAALKKTGDEPGFQDEELDTAYNIAQAQGEASFCIVPIRLEDCERGDARVSSYQQYDLFPAKNFEAGLDKLALHHGGQALADQAAVDNRSEAQRIREALRGKAKTFQYAGDTSNALKTLDVLTELYPDFAWAYYTKADVKHDRGDYEGSLYDLYQGAMKDETHSKRCNYGPVQTLGKKLATKLIAKDLYGLRTDRYDSIFKDLGINPSSSRFGSPFDDEF